MSCRGDDDLTFNDCFEAHVMRAIGAKRTARMMKGVYSKKKRDEVIHNIYMQTQLTVSIMLSKIYIFCAALNNFIFH